MIDNYNKWEMYDTEQEKKLAKLPLCDICGEPIQDDYYFEINGERICEDCLTENYRKDIDYYD